jgi:SAM-dependent methyltransferase
LDSGTHDPPLGAQGLAGALLSDRSVEPKPSHLSADFAAQFGDQSVADAYSSRPPYPAEVFSTLKSLLPDGPRMVLDLGCGTGDVSIPLAAFVDEIDGVDPSAAMLAVARAREGGDDPRLRWTCSSAELFDLRGPYSLIVAAESIHWMDWEVVLPRLVDALLPRAFLAIVTDRWLVDVPWENELSGLIREYSTNRSYQHYDLVAELTRRGLFTEVGRHTTDPVAFQQPVGPYVESFHSRNGFSRDRMQPEASRAFDEALRSLVLSHSPEGSVRLDELATVVWGFPSVAPEAVERDIP